MLLKVMRSVDFNFGSKPVLLNITLYLILTVHMQMSKQCIHLLFLLTEIKIYFLFSSVLWSIHVDRVSLCFPVARWIGGQIYDCINFRLQKTVGIQA